MNSRRVLHMLGLVLFVLACAQLLPLAWAIRPFDPVSAAALLAGSGITATLGLLFRRLGNDDGELYRREGVLVGAWLLASITGAIPYLVSGAIPYFVDALFESASGFTTTGASILTDIEALPRSLLFWRSLTQWLGGIGIIVLFVALLSELGPGARFLFKLEVPGPKAEILHARVQETAVALFKIYLGLSVAQCILMLLFGASLFDALTHTFSTVSTGGFSPYADSAAHLSTPLQIIVLGFMLAADINFALYYAFIRRRNFGVLGDRELRVYLGLAAAASALITFDLAARGNAIGRSLLDASFQTVSVLTTTGFATVDFAGWIGLPKTILVALMFVGGCAGSTAGGAKIIRILIAGAVALREVRLTFNPNSVFAIAVGDRVVPEDSARGVVALLLL